MQRLQKRGPRAGRPVAAARGQFAAWHHPIARNGAKMVNAHHIIPLCRALNAVFPPPEAVRLHDVPRIERVAPELTVGTEIVRRDTGDGARLSVRVEAELPRLRPDVRAVGGDIHGQVTDDAHTVRVRIGAHRVPLAGKLCLQIGVQQHARIELRGRLCECGGVTVAQRRRPGVPRCAALRLLDGHIQAVIHEPRLRRERGAQRGHDGSLFARKCRSPERGLARVHAAVVHAHRIAAPVDGAHLVERERTALDQRLRREQVGAAGKGRRRQVRRVRAVRRVEGQDLPVALPGGSEKIDKLPGGCAQIADAARPRQSRHRQQDTA